ncbi:MAG: hypothetical protein KKD44_03470 [Proteobacteria bacterium]|nr:hypothetical protein [Pseudomonadota bacterium]
MDSHGLTLYYNALSHVSIQWNDIKSAIKSTYEKDNIKTAGGRVRFTINQKETSEAILLEFFKPINKEINNSNVQISDNGHKLRILAPPDGGLGNLLVSINEYLNKEPKNLSRHGKNKILTVINIAIFMLSITFILINISKFILN